MTKRKTTSRIQGLTICLFLLLVTILSCQDEKSELETFFDELALSIEDEKLELFKKSELDSAGKTIASVRHEVEMEVNGISLNSALGIYLDSISNGIQEVKINFVSIGLHYQLNDKKIEFSSIDKELLKIAEYNLQKLGKKISNEKVRIAMVNDSVFIVGDTINAYLEIDSFFDKNEIVYSQGIIDVNDPIEFVGVSGIITKKEFDKLYSSNKIDSSQLIFKLKVIEISLDYVYSEEKVIKPGDTIPIYVTDYGRILGKGPLVSYPK